MRVALFCHSLRSDWNNGNAHFLRGIVTELALRDHDVRVFEPGGSWSVENLVRDHGEAALDRARDAYPFVKPEVYDPERLDLDAALDGVDLVIVHEWNTHELVRRVGDHRKRASSRYRLLFHDTHHRSVTDPRAMAAYDLSGYDGVLAFGAAIKHVYECNGWGRRAFVWHEAADVRVFRPGSLDLPARGDVVWIGNWGDDERTEELRELFLDPVTDLGLHAVTYGVRYPEEALRELAARGVLHCGWLANFEAPSVLSQYAATVHVPRRPYVAALPGIPTIRVFEALACGVPLVSGPWDDVEGLFTEGADYLRATCGADVRKHLRALLGDGEMRRAFARRGRETILARHTCAHRVDELVGLARQLGIFTHDFKAPPTSSEVHP